MARSKAPYTWLAKRSWRRWLRGNRNVVHKIPTSRVQEPTTLEMCDVVTYIVEDPIRTALWRQGVRQDRCSRAPAVANAVYDRSESASTRCHHSEKCSRRCAQEKGEARGSTAAFRISRGEPIRVPPWEGEMECGAGSPSRLAPGSVDPDAQLPPSPISSRTLKDALAMKADAGLMDVRRRGTDLYPT